MDNPWVSWNNLEKRNRNLCGVLDRTGWHYVIIAFMTIFVCFSTSFVFQRGMMCALENFCVLCGYYLMFHKYVVHDCMAHNPFLIRPLVMVWAVIGKLLHHFPNMSMISKIPRLTAHCSLAWDKPVQWIRCSWGTDGFRLVTYFVVVVLLLLFGSAVNHRPLERRRRDRL